MRVEVLKIVAVLVVGAAFFVGGYQYAAALYGADIAALREDYATRGVSGFLCLGRLFQGQPNEAALCI